MTARRVLLVDDDQATVDVMTQYLRRRQIDVASYTEAADALVRLSEDPDIALVVCDIRMDCVDGFDVLAAAARRPVGRALSTPVIVMTGHATPSDEARALRAGARHFMAKPLNLPDVLAAIRGTMEEVGKA